MNKLIHHSGIVWFTATALLCTIVMCNAYAQTSEPHASIINNTTNVQSSNLTHGLDNRMNVLKTRRFSCTLNQRPGDQHELVYSTNTGFSELSHMLTPSVLSAGKYILASDGYSLYQFEYSNEASHDVKLPKYTSDHMIIAVTEQSIIQKHRIDKQSCVTKAPLSNPNNESTLFCSDTYYKVRYDNNSVYILSDVPCIKDKSNKNCKDKSVSLERYTLDGNKSWNVTLNRMPSSSIVGIWHNVLLILNANASLTALDTETGSIIYTKDYSSELSLEKDFYQFNHFYTDKDSGLFIVASRHHNIIHVIDIKTGSLIKQHDFGKAYAHNKFLEEDYHYIELGEFAFPLNTIMGIDNGILFLRKDKNELAAIELKTGNQLWKYDIFNSPLNTDSTQNRDDIAYHIGDILITDDLVIIGYHKFATALNKNTGDVVWNFNFFPFNGYFGYQMYLSCIDNHLLIQNDNIYLY